MIAISTAELPVGDRLDFWSHNVLKRMQITRAEPGTAPFQGSLRRVVGQAGEFWDHASTAIQVERSRQRCEADGGAEIYVGLVVDGHSEVTYGDEPVRLRPGDLYVTDFARPVRAHWFRHREIGVVFERAAAIEAAGGRIVAAGAGKLLASHLRALADTTASLSPEERSAAVDIAVQFARLALRGAAARSDEPGVPGLLAAARRLIAQRCSDPELSADLIATWLGCSRATLYRAFQREGTSVASAIWSARLAQARTLLAGEPAASIGSIAFRSGFLDQANFNRMFRREFGMPPGEFKQSCGTAEAALQPARTPLTPTGARSPRTPPR